MALIPEDLIDEVQRRADITELIGRYVPLKRAGRHFKAQCPFHKERTPSFMVNIDKQIFHCFGCGVGGNVFSFLMRHDRLTFPEAVQQVAHQVGVHIPEHRAAAEHGSRAMLSALMERASQHFEQALLGPAGGAARAYLQRRGVSERARASFRLGLAVAGWETLLTAAKAWGSSAAQLTLAGLAIKRDPSGSYDRFRGRLMFPIVDVRGRVVGFGGRSLDDQEPKYLNSPETPLYSKGRHLFGLAQAKEAIVRAKTAIVVEGYFDCVVLADAGFPHVVSPLGTALTIEQAHLLRRYAEQVILAFDPDAAGEQATLRGIDLLVESGLQVRVAQLPPGIDPDECLRAQGRERFERLLADGVGLLEFLLQSARRRYPTDRPEEKVRAAQCVLPTIARVADPLLRSEYARWLSDRLHLDERAMSEELGSLRARLQGRDARGREGADERPAPRGTVSRPMTPSSGAGPERLLAALVLDEPARWRRLDGHLSLEEIADPALRQILSVVARLEASGQPVTAAQVVSRLSEEAGAEGLVASLVEFTRTLEAKDDVFEECVQRLRLLGQKRQLASLRERIRVAQRAGIEREVQELLAQYQRRLAELHACRSGRSISGQGG